MAQWLALVLAGDRVPLAAHYFAYPELHAAQIMLAAQFSWTAILFPVLCRSWRMGIAAIVCGWVMLVLAAMLSAWQMRDVLPAAGCLGLWLVALVLWRQVLEADWLQLMGSALIAAFTIGGPLVWYLGMDLGPGASEQASWKFGPLLGMVLHPTAPPIADLLILVLMAISAITILLLRHFFACPTSPH